MKAASERLRSALLRAATESSASEKQSSLTPADVGGLVLDTLGDDASPLFGPKHGMLEVSELRNGGKRAHKRTS